MSSTALARPERAGRVLVVEDNRTTREALLLLLQSEGFDADGVENGHEALRVLREGYDACLILLDLMMPVMDGWTFRFEQRRDPNLTHIPVVVLTATVDPVQEGNRLGAIGAFQKPLDIEPLLSLIAEHCPRRST